MSDPGIYREFRVFSGMKHIYFGTVDGKLHITLMDQMNPSDMQRKYIASKLDFEILWNLLMQLPPGGERRVG